VPDILIGLNVLPILQGEVPDRARVRRVLIDLTEPMVGLALQLRALGAEGCDAVVATGVTPAGVWR
jgi:hypothetical protein